MLNNLPTSLLLVSPDARLRDSGTMSRMLLVCCSIRMRISRRWWPVGLRLFRLLLEIAVGDGCGIGVGSKG
jgi:hypothetical protein